MSVGVSRDGRMVRGRGVGDENNWSLSTYTKATWSGAKFQ